MNANDCLPKDRHDQRVGRIGSREFHVVSELVRRDALQHELTGIRIFAFIALQRNTKKPDANNDHKTKNDHREKNPCGFQKSVAFCSLALHRFFNETKDYSPQWPGKQHKREKLSALPQPTEQPQKLSRSAGLQHSGSSPPVWPSPHLAFFCK